MVLASFILLCLYPRFYKSFRLDNICCPRLSPALSTLLCALGEWTTCVTSMDNLGLSWWGALAGTWRKRWENHCEITVKSIESLNSRSAHSTLPSKFSHRQRSSPSWPSPADTSHEVLHCFLWPFNNLLPLLFQFILFLRFLLKYS